MSTGVVEIGFVKRSDLDGRVDKTIVVFRDIGIIDGLQWCRDMPIAGDMAETQEQRRVSRVNRIHEKLGEIEEGVMNAQLRAEGAGRVEINLILHDCARGSSVNLPAAFVEFADCQSISGAILGANPVDVLGKVTDLIQSIPYRQLQFAVGRSRRQGDSHLHKMLFGIGERNCIGELRPRVLGEGYVGR